MNREEINVKVVYNLMEFLEERYEKDKNWIDRKELYQSPYFSNPHLPPKGEIDWAIEMLNEREIVETTRGNKVRYCPPQNELR
ncbi:MAG: hypothetical protein AB1414_10540 [bacterium]